MAEGDTRLERDHAGRLGRQARRFRDPKTLGRPPDERGITRRFARRDEDQETRVTRKGIYSREEALLDPGVHRGRRRYAEATREL